MVTKTTTRTQAKRRHFGVPVSKLSVNLEIPGYHLRWINDDPGRIHNALDSGYEFVTPAEVGRESRDGDRVKELVGTQRNQTEALYAYLMKIKEEFYLEDRGLLESQVDSIDSAIRGGKINSQQNDGRYIPKSGITYKTE